MLKSMDKKIFLQFYVENVCFSKPVLEPDFLCEKSEYDKEIP